MNEAEATVPAALNRRMLRIFILCMVTYLYLCINSYTNYIATSLFPKRDAAD